MQVHQQVMAGKPRLALVPRLGSSSNRATSDGC
jgi:hypothetical protein